ncbi:MAG TPA: hypothetical protein VK927_03160, partial [Adhaeribacter sp.]|nr:hypothetical protein [Adhaeribacter sp.]
MNFRTILTTLILSFSVLTGFAQQINWIRGGYGLSGGWDYVTGFHRDTNGNFYVLMPMAGGGPWPASPAYGVNFFGTEVQPPISNKKYNVIGKFDSNMNLLWVEPFLCQHNVGSAYAQENIAVDQIGSIYVSYVDTTYKFNSNGKLVWRKGFSGQRIKVNKQGQLEIYQFKNAGNTLGGNPIVNRAGTVATFDSSGNYVRHFTVNDPVFQAQTIFGKNQYGYYGVRTAQNTQYFRCRQEIFVCDSLGNTLSNSLINYSNSLNNGGLVNATFDPVLKKYYVLGFFRDTNPINKRDSSAVLSPNRLSLLQIDTSLQINNVLNMGAPHNITTGGGMFYLTPYKGSLFFTVKTIFPAKFFTHLGMLNYHGTAYNKLLIGKLDPNLNPVWTMNIGNVGNGTLIQYPIPTENGIFYAGSSGNFSNNQITFTADQGHLGWNDTFLMKITDKDSTTAQLTGRVFHDLNQNGTDDNEPGVSSQTIESDHASGISYSSEDGTYQISAAAGQNTLRAGSLPQYWARSTPDSLQVNVPALATQLHGFNFGIYPVAGIKDASVSLTPLTAARLNMPVSYQLTYRNQATDVLNGMVKVIKPAELIFQNATVAPDMISGDTLFWNYSGLKPEEKRSIVLQFTLPNDPAFNNRYLFSQAAISPLAGDTIKANNVAEVYHLVTGPFDPNDITVTPSCPVSPAFVTDGKYLEYRIRFQNVGTDTAFSVVIKDSLSVHFDLASLEFTDQSHPAKVWLKDNLLTLYFENIKLPHSAINYAGSHGFFTYRVKLKANTAVGTTIKNRAAIFFDYNDPIWTNQVITPVASYNNPFTVSAQPAACFGGATGQIT